MIDTRRYTNRLPFFRYHVFWNVSLSRLIPHAPLIQSSKQRRKATFFSANRVLPLTNERIKEKEEIERKERSGTREKRKESCSEIDMGEIYFIVVLMKDFNREMRIKKLLLRGVYSGKQSGKLLRCFRGQIDGHRFI